MGALVKCVCLLLSCVWVRGGGGNGASPANTSPHLTLPSINRASPASASSSSSFYCLRATVWYIICLSVTEKKRSRIEAWIFKITSLTRKSLWLMTIVDICHFLPCIFVYVYVCIFHCSSAVLFIRRAVSLSWQCLRGTSVGILTMHGTELEFCGWGAQRMLVCSYAVIMRPVVLLLSWQTPTSQLRTHS